MKIERLVIELEYDDKMMHNDEPEAVEWFWLDVMGGGELYLHSNEIGDEVGRVKVISRLREPPR